MIKYFGVEIFICSFQKKKNLFFSVGVHVMVQDVNEFAPKWNIRSEDIANEPLHTLTTGVSIEEGQLFEEVSASVCNVYCVNILAPKLTIFLLEME